MKSKKIEKNIFQHILANNLVAGTTNNLIWFALTFWVYITTNSVLATSWIAWLFTVVNMISALFFGNFVDRHTKKNVMKISSIASLVAYSVWAGIFFLSDNYWTDPWSLKLWMLIIVLMIGSLFGNLRNIAMTTLITLLFQDKKREKANGNIATMNGFTFAITAITSGICIGFFGMQWVIIFCVVSTIASLIHIMSIACPEEKLTHMYTKKSEKCDIRWTIKLVKSVPGYFSLILLSTFNNFLWGVFMALMDPYGLSLVSVEKWGVLWGCMSFSFIIGGAIVSRVGIGKNPVRTLILFNIITWFVCIFFTIQASLVFLVVGTIAWMILVPIIEASEQTILQKVIPYHKQGSVIGFAQSIESAASPLTTFLIGPLAQFFFIPFMTTGLWVELIGGWFGVGEARGMALIFCLTGIIGFVTMIIARCSTSYKNLSKACE